MTSPARAHGGGVPREGSGAALRVVRVIARLNVGGPARHVTILDRGLRRRGFDTLLVYGRIGPGEGSMGRLVSEVGLPAHRIDALGRRLSLIDDLRAFVALLRLMFRLRPDVVHTHTAKAGTLGRIAAWIYNAVRRPAERAVVVHTFHGHVLYGYFGRVGSRLVRFTERLLARATDVVLVLSARQRDEIGVAFAIAPVGKIRIVPLGLELDALLRTVRRPPDPAAPVVFGYVGRFVPIKNLPLLIEAFAQLHASRPLTRLMLVGDGTTMTEIRAAVARHGLEHVVSFEGWRHDLAEVYAAMDVLVLTSRNEGTPVAVIEAMAAGVPVVATAVGGVPDVVDPGETGLLVSGDRVDELSAALLRLADDSAERQKFGAAGRLSVRERFSAERLVTDVASLYQDVLAARRGTAQQAHS